MRGIVAAGAAALIVAGCGSSGPTQAQRTAAATRCFKDALANQALDAGNNCNDSTAAHVLSQGSGTRVTVNCVHQNGNVYVCQVQVPTVEGVQLTTVRPGMYSVTYDGHGIAYRQTS